MIQRISDVSNVIIGWENRLPAKILSETSMISQIADLVSSVIFEGGNFRTLHIDYNNGNTQTDNTLLRKSISNSLRELFKLAVTTRCLDMTFIGDTSMCNYTYVSNEDINLYDGKFRIQCANNELPSLARYFLWNKDTKNISDTLFQKLKKIEYAGYCHHEDNEGYTMSFECMLSRNNESDAKGFAGDLVLTMQIIGYDGEKLYWDVDTEGRNENVPMLAKLSGIDTEGKFRESLEANQAAVYGISLNLSQLMRNTYELPSIETLLEIENKEERDEAICTLVNTKFSKTVMLFDGAYDSVIEYAYV